MSTEPANPRLQHVTDVDQLPDKTGPIAHMVLGVIALTFCGVLWAFYPSNVAASTFNLLALGSFIFAIGFGAWIGNRRRRSRGHPGPQALLDGAPIQLSGVRWPVAAFAPAAALYLVGGVFELLDRELWFGLVQVFVGATGLIVSLKSVIRPTRLRIEASGFGDASEPLTPWRDVVRFKADRSPNIVVYSLADTPSQPEGRSSRGGAREGWLSAVGPIPADRLAELLNAAKARWG